MNKLVFSIFALVFVASAHADEFQVLELGRTQEVTGKDVTRYLRTSGAAARVFVRNLRCRRVFEPSDSPGQICDEVGSLRVVTATTVSERIGRLFKSPRDKEWIGEYNGQKALFSKTGERLTEWCEDLNYSNGEFNCLRSEETEDVKRVAKSSKGKRTIEVKHEIFQTSTPIKSLANCEDKGFSLAELSKNSRIDLCHASNNLGEPVKLELAKNETSGLCGGTIRVKNSFYDVKPECDSIWLSDDSLTCESSSGSKKIAKLPKDVAQTVFKSLMHEDRISYEAAEEHLQTGALYPLRSDARNTELLDLATCPNQKSTTDKGKPPGQTGAKRG